MKLHRCLINGIFLSALAACFGIPLTAQARATGEAITAGGQWLLQARHQFSIWALVGPTDVENGELTPESFTTTYTRDTFEAVRALQVITIPATEYQQALTWIDQSDFSLADLLARKIVVLAKANVDVTPFVGQLLAYRNLDGGFGSAVSYPSDALSTAAALEAFAAAGRSGDPAVTGAVNYLLAVQQGNGGFTEGDNVASVYLTAHAFRALWPYRNTFTQIPPALERARDFLLSARDGSGAWVEQFDTALALTALIPYLPDTASIAISITSLQSAQLPNGSWANDPYTTALALQALYLASLPSTNPDLSTITGKVIDGSTGLPLKGVSVALNGPTPGSVLTNDAGVFTFVNRVAGSYQAQLSFADYAPVVISATTSPGSSVDVGTLTMTKGSTPTTATVRGIVTDAATRLPLRGAVVTASSAAAAAITDAAGAYQLSGVSPGLAVLRVTRTGYLDAGSSVSLAAGEIAVFSPALTARNGTVSIHGRVIDSATLSPLFGATVSLAGAMNASTLTLADGSFSFTGLLPGSYNLQISLARYASLSASVLTEGGQVNIGDVALHPVTSPPLPSTTGTIRGVVTDATTQQPLSGVAVSVSGGATVLTDGTGAYQLNAVPAGTVLVQASLSGYNTAAGSATLNASSLVVFSPALAPMLAFGELQGTVRHGVTGAPLAGAAVSVSGSTVASALTDASGQYRIQGVNPGTLSVRVSLTGFDNVTAAATVVAGRTLTFSPALYPTGTTPPGANTSSVKGVVLDAGTNRPIAGAGVAATFDGIAVNAATNAAGDFELTNISAVGGSLVFTAAGYVSANIDVALTPISVLDVGQVRLRGEAPQLPDLTVSSVDRRGAVNDPHTLAVSGTLSLAVANKGSAAAPPGVRVLAFFDVNGNGAYEALADTVLGESTIAASIAVDATTTVAIPISGQLPFRHASISVWVDSRESVAERNERNNIGSTARACELRPDPSTFAPVLKWQTSGVGGVSHSPIVGPLIDTNSDGRIDANDVPAVIFIDHDFTGMGELTAVSGTDGRRLWRSSVGLRGADGSTPALGDLDGDGRPEIVTYDPDNPGAVIAFNNNGTVKWRSSARDPNRDNIAFTIVDLDGDGRAEVLAGNLVLNHDGSLRWAGNPAGVTQSIPIAVDLDLDGSPEVIMGPRAYRADGSLYWEIPDGFRNFAAVGNFDDDPYPEIVVVQYLRVSLYKYNGQRIWGPVFFHGPTNNGGPPTVADFDGDGKLDIGIAVGDLYRVFNADGSSKWSAPGLDGSGLTGSTAFDFDGDGHAEVLYANEGELRVFDGRNGAVLFRTPNPSRTWVEYPVVADVDGDRHADIVLASSLGVRVFQDQNNAWVATRKIWNQHAYHIDNINDDGAVPPVEVKGWLTHNTYRLNAFPDRSATAQADLTASLLTAIDGGAGQPVGLRLRVGNGGLVPSLDQVRVGFYQGAPASGGTLLGTVTLAPVAAGAYRDIRLDNVTLSVTADLYALVDIDNRVAECDEDNNTTFIPFAAASTKGRIAVSTDALSYGPNSPVALNGTVTNTSSFLRSYNAELRVEDSLGAVLARFTSPTLGPLASGASLPIAGAWNTQGSLAGTYYLHGLLYGTDAKLLHEATSAFAIGQAGTTPTASLRLTTDRSTYHTIDQVSIQSLIANLTTNVLVNQALLRLAVLDDAGTTLFTRDLALGQLLPGALRDVLQPYSFTGASVATYRVTGQVIDTVTQSVLASAQTSFVVSTDLGKSLSGRVEAQLPVVEGGASQVCTDTLRNLGTTAAMGIEVHDALVNIDTSQLVNETIRTVTLPAGGIPSVFARSFTTSGLAPGNYACVLQARISGNLNTLGFAPFKVTVPPIRIDAELKVGAKGRLLVLLDDARRCADGDHHSSSHASSSNNCVRDRDPHGPNDAPRLSVQRAFLEGLLTSAGWSYTVTERDHDFAREFRSGGYTLYAILAEQEKLSESTQKQLREAVFRGEGLVVAGSHDARHHKLLGALGIKLIGQVSSAIEAELQQNPLNLSGRIGLLSGDKNLRIKLNGAQSIARYRLGGRSYQAHSDEPDCRDLGQRYQNSEAAKSDKSSSHSDDDRDECDGGEHRYIDAMTINAYGRGRSLFAGFDLLAIATREGAQSLSARTLLAALDFTGPPPRARLGGVVPVQFTLTNRGMAADTVARILIPAGTAVVDAGGGTLETTPQGLSIKWTVPLAVNDEKALLFYLRLPALAGTVSLHGTVNVIQSGVSREVAQTDLAIVVAPVASLDALAARASALGASLPAHRNALRQAKADIEQAIRARSLDKAVSEIVQATDRLLGLNDAGIVALRVDLGEWLRYSLMLVD